MGETQTGSLLFSRVAKRSRLGFPPCPCLHVLHLPHHLQQFWRQRVKARHIWPRGPVPSSWLPWSGVAIIMPRNVTMAKVVLSSLDMAVKSWIIGPRRPIIGLVTARPVPKHRNQVATGKARRRNYLSGSFSAMFSMALPLIHWSTSAIRWGGRSFLDLALAPMSRRKIPSMAAWAKTKQPRQKATPHNGTLWHRSNNNNKPSHYTCSGSTQSKPKKGL